MTRVDDVVDVFRGREGPSWRSVLIPRELIGRSVPSDFRAVSGEIQGTGRSPESESSSEDAFSRSETTDLHTSNTLKIFYKNPQ